MERASACNGTLEIVCTHSGCGDLLVLQNQLFDYGGSLPVHSDGHGHAGCPGCGGYPQKSEGLDLMFCREVEVLRQFGASVRVAEACYVLNQSCLWLQENVTLHVCHLTLLGIGRLIVAPDTIRYSA